MRSKSARSRAKRGGRIRPNPPQAGAQIDSFTKTARYIAVTKRLDRMRSCAHQPLPPSHAPRVAHFLLPTPIAHSILSFLRPDRGRVHVAHFLPPTPIAHSTLSFLPPARRPARVAHFLPPTPIAHSILSFLRPDRGR